MKNFKLRTKLASFALAMSLTSLTGCTKTVDCDIEEDHAHVYVDNETGIKRYIESEKVESSDGEARTDEYILLDEMTEKICDNNLCLKEENIDALEKLVNNYYPKREAYVYDYIYGYYYGYSYGYNPMNGKIENCYRRQEGYHWDYEWQEISMNEYTEDKVRDITYEYKFYKIDENGKLVSKCFNSLDDIEKDYIYFKKNDLIVKIISEDYYLDKEEFLK